MSIDGSYRFVRKNGDKMHWFNTIEESRDENGEFHSSFMHPAVILEGGTSLYYKHGKLHNLNGPAVMIYNDIEDDIFEYYVEGDRVSYEEWVEIRKDLEDEKEEK